MKYCIVLNIDGLSKETYSGKIFDLVIESDHLCKVSCNGRSYSLFKNRLIISDSIEYLQNKLENIKYLD